MNGQKYIKNSILSNNLLLISSSIVYSQMSPTIFANIFANELFGVDNWRRVEQKLVPLTIPANQSGSFSACL